MKNEEVVEYVDRVASCCADVSDELKEILDFQKINIPELVEKLVSQFVVLEYHFHQ